MANRDPATEAAVRALDAQLPLLPDLQERAFVMREVEGREPEGICKHLGISAAELDQLLLEARIALCAALERGGFGRR